MNPLRFRYATTTIDRRELNEGQTAEFRKGEAVWLWAWLLGYVQVWTATDIASHMSLLSSTKSDSTLPPPISSIVCPSQLPVSSVPKEKARKAQKGPKNIAEVGVDPTTSEE
ncbi:hypothetical protein EJ06DRAFT_526827 [Trichodelitschia bisporula]|uniref:Uncharacterized protein n=1 Tax=Trichodelitschia bisporula TaxID=703511 RepID=A0A6G1I8W5_9PEZI|nr:hypothetical protein EJ06DRAFT_526827 [Trichodelitschia bisporula]